ncbi:MAG: hypothetical protein A2901_00455 [Elusimicrobia bacterium RIFCSPLOWO2_01_FULL_54_10]|nr:MAG: hypothetical protein A2901_00455 [Elusimicrobia bacterium RIFCSPLOWO2_01_FULL_54_10]
MAVTGTGGNASGSGTDNYGVHCLTANCIQTTSTGILTVTGTGSASSGGTNYGVIVRTPGSITAAGGAMTITGTGGNSSGSNNRGVLVTGAAAVISNTGSGTISITGNGAGITNSGSDYGLRVDTGGIISTVDGNLTVSATGGGAGTGTANYGVYVSSTIKTTGTGNLSVTGIRGGGDTATNYGVNVAIANGFQTTSTGTITVITDTILLAQANNINSIGSLTIRPYTATSTVGVGAGSGTLGLTDTFLTYITWGTSSTLTIGGTTAGNIAINSASTILNQSVTFLTGGDITLATTALAHAGASAATLTMQAYGTITTTSAITAATSALTILLYSDFDANASGTISIGAGVQSNGGTITVQGGGGTISTASTFDNLTVVVGSNTITLGATFNDSGNLTITSGTFDVSATPYAANIGGNYSNSGTFTARTGTVTLNGSAAQALSGTMTGSSAFYDLTLTNSSGTVTSDCERTGWVAGVDFNAAATVTNNYTVATASVKVEYESGATYTINNMNWNGQAVGTRLYFRNSAITGTWLLNVTAVGNAQTKVSYINVSRSDASGGALIIASDGTNTDCGTNTNWQFDETLTLGIDSTSKDFGTILPGANPSDQTSTLTATSNAVNGYVIYAWSTQAMTNVRFGGVTLADWTGTNATPTTFSAGSNGFGYSTDDASLTGGTADRFTNGGAKFAGFSHTGPGDPVADRTAPATAATNDITYRLYPSNTQANGDYTTVVVYVITAAFP